MSQGLGSIPPSDARQDEARRAAARRRSNEGLLLVALVFGQLGLAAGLGWWAASGWNDPSGGLPGLAALGFVLLLIGAHAVGYGAVLLFGSVALLASLPRLFRRRTPGSAAATPRAGADPAGTLVVAVLVAVHASALLAGALLLCTGIALSSDLAGIGAWWRFALAALLLTPVTARLLLAWVRSELA